MIDLSLRTLGPFQATLSDKPLTDFRTRKVQALLVFLATERDAQRREHLAGETRGNVVPVRTSSGNATRILL